MNGVCALNQGTGDNNPKPMTAMSSNGIAELKRPTPTPVVETGDAEPDPKRLRLELPDADRTAHPSSPHSVVNGASSEDRPNGRESSSDETSTTEPAKRPQHAPAECPPPSPPPPLKSTLMTHLRKKYLSELEYMLREFRKLERQLLGAKGNGTGIEESAGSRERREKLHTFILHLEDTIRQIEVGCQLEAEGKSTIVPTEQKARQQAADNAALTNLTKEKEEEENVQKLEEHILANLLPVKVRLKKQLAAQQGATRNPAGMPVTRRGTMQMGATEKGKGTFVAAAELRQKQVEAARAAAQQQSQNSSDDTDGQATRPLHGAGSSLTKKLHGSKMGSKERKLGPEPSATDTDSLGSASKDGQPRRKVLYAGMAIGSQQHQSGISAAAGVHKMVVDTPSSTTPKHAPPPPPPPPQSKAPTPAAPQPAKRESAAALLRPVPQQVLSSPMRSQTKPTASSPHNTKVKQSDVHVPSAKSSSKKYNDPSLPDDERRRIRKMRRRRKKLRDARRREKERQRKLFMQNQAAQASMAPPKSSPMGLPLKKTGKISSQKSAGKKKGPRTVEYICALCSEVYNSTCDCNPWWALTSHECPKCRKSQVPRVDITSPANTIEYHPALLAHADDGNNSGPAPVPPPPQPPHTTSAPLPPRAPTSGGKHLSDSDSDYDLSELSDCLSDDSYFSDGIDADVPMSPADHAENENFGKDYNGPRLTPDHASRLLILMEHASTCPGRHKSGKHRDVCNSVKFLMLHARDCPGTTSNYDICPFPWCRKVKHLLYHLVACPRPKDCAICSPIALSPNLHQLIGLNGHRRERHAQKMIVAMAAEGAAKNRSAATSKHSKASESSSSSKRHKGESKSKPRSGDSKLTNGVIVKTLVKPANRLHASAKSATSKPAAGVRSGAADTPSPAEVTSTATMQPARRRSSSSRQSAGAHVQTLSSSKQPGDSSVASDGGGGVVIMTPEHTLGEDAKAEPLKELSPACIDMEDMIHLSHSEPNLAGDGFEKVAASNPNLLLPVETTTTRTTVTTIGLALSRDPDAKRSSDATTKKETKDKKDLPKEVPPV